MPTYIPTPRSNVYSKTSAGTSNTSISNNVYKFMGCSVVNVNSVIGFNGSASSLSLTLVEDTQNGDSFQEPTIPSAWGFSLPSGGVGQSVFVSNSFDFNPNGFTPTNVPFYFAGICTNWQEARRDVGGKLINVTISDPREVLSGIQCLLGGFALSQNFTGLNPRYSQVDNVIDVFGYFNYGLEADKNEYGMLWSEIKQALEAVQVSINGIKFEFYFTGEAYTSYPDWYRINENIVDILSLAQKVAEDGGSDLIVIGRKVATDTIVCEFRAIRRTNNDPLTQAELEDFVSARSDIVDAFKIGKEYRNEPNSSVIIGGLRNSNYTAYPSSYSSAMHLRSGKEDYNAFPSDIKIRLFGGSGTVYQESATGSGLNPTVVTFNVNSGAIYPFWGFSPSGTQYPLIEPFLNLDHFSFDKTSDTAASLRTRLPRCKIGIQYRTVRQVVHDDVFLDGDGDSDSRPFAYVEDVLGSGADLAGYVRGLPLNTEVMRAAMVDEHMFYNLYGIYYPEYAKDLNMPYMNFRMLSNAINGLTDAEKQNLDIRTYFNYTIGTDSSINASPIAQKLFLTRQETQDLNFLADSVLHKFKSVIYNAVKDYALSNMGKRFLACLPRSEIMNRIWSGLPVPTNPDHPIIEYTTADRGFWETLPFELDGVVGNSGTSAFNADEENQIRRRFMAEDGRFYPMIGIDWKPSGNISFNSNGINKAMFQDLPISDFRPNKISSSNPSFVLAACSINQLVKRPDLALVEFPGLYFDPQVNYEFHHGFIPASGGATYASEKIYPKLGIMKHLWYFYKRDPDLRSAILKIATAKGDVNLAASIASDMISAWADYNRAILTDKMQADANIEPVMDFKGIIIPLTSNWVSYGPWYATSGLIGGMAKVEVDESLVPWNFERSDPWDYNLEVAGNEALDRAISTVVSVDNAVISVAGFPELGLSQPLGFNSNLTSINTDFGINGIKTVYSFSTYARKPGTYRKSEYDNVSRARFDTRPDIVDPVNISLSDEFYNKDANGRFNPFKF